MAFIDLDAGFADSETINDAVAAAEGSTCALVGVTRRRVSAELERLVRALACTLTDAQQPANPATVPVRSLDEEIAALADAGAVSPIAVATLARLLPLTAALEVREGLVAESLAYSTLLAGPEFSRWLRGRRRPSPPEERDDPVLVHRENGVLTITLNRPHKRNAYNRRMRDQLVEALTVAASDQSISAVEVRGNGPSFCSGGDLDEFGTTPDPATAHIVRVSQSVALLLHACADRVRVRVHGACIGAGVELASFASRVTATPDAFFSLPEIEMGLIPGAGGTVGITRRIGRWRTAYLALSGRRLDVDTALSWGLIDSVEDG